MPIFKVIFLFVCLGISLLQSYYEIDNFLTKRILTSSDIIDVKNAPIHLVFCDTYPLENRVCIMWWLKTNNRINACFDIARLWNWVS